jgi:outer membrane protein assembly factor BamE (lipoprotein component of BamABCDE complex)
MALRLALSLLLLGALGCTHLKGPFRPVEGEDFAAENLDQIHEGMAAEEALRLLGEPLERTPINEGERWRYYVLEERVDEKRLLGAAVRKWRWERWSEAELLVENGRVAEVSYDSKVTPPE